MEGEHAAVVTRFWVPALLIRFAGNSQPELTCVRCVTCVIM
jgi:hypothetical protein